MRRTVARLKSRLSSPHHGSPVRGSAGGRERKEALTPPSPPWRLTIAICKSLCHPPSLSSPTKGEDCWSLIPYTQMKTAIGEVSCPSPLMGEGAGGGGINAASPLSSPSPTKGEGTLTYPGQCRERGNRTSRALLKQLGGQGYSGIWTVAGAPATVVQPPLSGKPD